MRFVLSTYPDPDYAVRWDPMSEEERASSLTHHIAWFAKYRPTGRSSRPRSSSAEY